MAMSSKSVADGVGSSLDLVDRLGGVVRALATNVSTLPSTPRLPGGEAEAALLQHHMGCCAKLQETRRVVEMVQRVPVVVAPGGAIYMNPTAVPALLSTRPPPEHLIGVNSAESAVKISAQQTSTRALKPTSTTAHSTLCERVSQGVRAHAAQLLQPGGRLEVVAPVAGDAGDVGRFAQPPAKRARFKT